MADHRREVRVFISSTFRDMKGERDDLVKFVFPQLRKLCESRGVAFTDVDLRWGVTDEQKAEGKVLPICLEEIRRCRPFFIGLLGERYGWVPQEIPEDLVEREKWLAEHRDGSVTELEFLHGVLNNPAMTNRACFYFRDPRFLDSLAAAAREDFTEADPARRAKLDALKDRIRRSGLAFREGYPDPKTLGDWVLADLTAAIKQEFPGEPPGPLEREAMDHEAFAQSRAGVYIGRKEYFDRLDAHAAGDGPPLVILGESGSGKSALVANWALGWRESHPQDLLLMHFIGSSPYSADWAAMLRRIMGEFKRRFGITEDIPDKPDALRQAFANWLHMAAAKGRAVLILDGLNQLEDRDGAPDLVWLPPEIPVNVRLILSTLPGRPLDDLTKRGWPTLDVKPMQPDERKELIGDYLAQFTKALSPARVDRIASAAQTANPLYLRVLLDELRLFGEHERLDERINHYLSANTIPALYERVLERYEQDYERERPGLVREAMTLLWAARRGLTDSELLDLLGENGRPLPRAAWSPLYLAAETALVSHSGLIRFFHDYLREAVCHRYLPTDEKERDAHVRLADYFQGRDIGMDVPRRDVQQSAIIGPRTLEELPWQLAEAHAWQRLYDLLRDEWFGHFLSEHDLYEMHEYWRQIEAKSPLRINADTFSGMDIQKAMLFANRGEFGYAEDILSVNVSGARFKHDEAGAQLYIAYLAMIFEIGGRDDEAMKLLDEVEKVSRASGFHEALAMALLVQSRVLLKRERLDEAEALLAEAEPLFRRTDMKEHLYEYLGNRAFALWSRGRLDEAMAAYREEESLLKMAGNREELQQCLINQARIAREQGDWPAATETLEKVAQECRQRGFQWALFKCLGEQANILRLEGRLAEGLALREQMDAMTWPGAHEEMTDEHLVGKAEVLQDLGRLQEALALLQEREQFNRQRDRLRRLQRILVDETNILCKLGKHDDAMTRVAEAEGISRRLGDKTGLADCLGAKAFVVREKGDPLGALELVQQQANLDVELRNYMGLASALVNQAMLLTQDLAEAEKAVPLLEAAHRLGTEHRLGSLAQGLRTATVIVLHALGRLVDDKEPVRALSLLQCQENLWRLLDAPEGLALALANQAEFLVRNLKDPGRAVPLLEEAHRLATQHRLEPFAGKLRQLMDTTANALGRDAVELLERNDVERGLPMLEQQVHLLRLVEDPEELARSLLHQAVALSEARGRAQDAAPLVEEAFHLVTKHKIESLSEPLRQLARRVVQRLWQAADAHLKAGEGSPAILLFACSARLSGLLSDVRGQVMSLANQASLSKLNRDDLFGAVAIAEEAFRLAHEHGLSDLKSGVVDIIVSDARSLRDDGRYDEALSVLDREDAFLRRFDEPALLIGCVRMRAEILEAKRDYEAALKAYEQHLELCRQAGRTQEYFQSIADQAMLLGKHLNRKDEALLLIEWARQIAFGCGAIEMVGILLRAREQLAGKIGGEGKRE